MVNGVILPDIEFDPDQTGIAVWRREVAAGNTILGLAEWQAQHVLRSSAA